MISLNTAQRLIARHCAALSVKSVSIDKSLGHVLAENVKADDSLPRFDNSAMDGYAVRANSTSSATSVRTVRLEIVDSVFAGEMSRRTLGPGEACRIMTGAPVPKGADAVAQKEEVSVQGGQIEVDHPIARGRHIRRRGGEVKKGRVILQKGLVIDAGSVGCLATLGRRLVRVHRRPNVSVIATGDETIPPGEKLLSGQIYDSNSYMVSAALEQMGITPVRVRHVKDHPTALRNAIEAALARSDCLIVTGGVSVGDRDYVRSVLERERIREVFWGVKQKPGKPFYFGARGRRVVFGLPGNPASVFTCFYVHVHPALRRLAGVRGGLHERKLPLSTDVASDRERWRLLKAKTLDEPEAGVAVLPRQASHMITTLAQTNSVVLIPPGVGTVRAGTIVTTYLLPPVEERAR
jgi:molybdopterin molybdotransferase